MSFLNKRVNVNIIYSKVIIVSFAVFLVYNVIAVDAREATGEPLGLIADCPGVSKPAGIKPETLKKMAISVMGSGPLIMANWTSYNYYQIQHLVKHPDIDFKNKKTFLFVPGYLDNNAFPIGRGLGEIYKNLGYNVLILDLVHFTTEVWPIIARLMRPVGKHAAEMLATLTTLGLNPKDLELLGLSLGGQTMGFIAKNYREITGKNISTLIALEPSGPCFRNLGPENRIDKSDADFVIHVASNMDGFGIAAPVGHVSFYLNGGEWQPGDVWWLPCGLMCSHARSFFVWISALLNPGSFIGVQCDSVEKARIGDCFSKSPKVTNTLDRFTDRSKPGIYFLATDHQYPYYYGKKGVELSSGFELTYKFMGKYNKEDMIWV